jgi:hypothetical protein
LAASITTTLNEAENQSIALAFLADNLLFFDGSINDSRRALRGRIYK